MTSNKPWDLHPEQVELWRQPEVVWINPPSAEIEHESATLFMAA